MKVLVALMLFFLVGCTTSIPVNSTPIITQESLLVECSADTPIPVNYVLDESGKRVYQGQELIRVLVQWQDIYNKCASTHNQLVKAIREVQVEKVKKP